MGTNFLALFINKIFQKNYFLNMTSEIAFLLTLITSFCCIIIRTVILKRALVSYSVEFNSSYSLAF